MFKILSASLVTFLLSTVAPAAEPTGRSDLLFVKFRDGQTLRAREGRLTDLGTGALAASAGKIDPLTVKGCRWERAIPDVSEARLEQMRRSAAAALGRNVADQNLEFMLWLGAGMDADATARELEGLAGVERAARWPVPPPPPTPDFSGQQGYRGASAAGIGATVVANKPGGTGAGVAFCDVEYFYNTAHADLPAITLLGAAATPPAGQTSDHGTAVLGEIVSMGNGFGVTGMAPGATPNFAAAMTNNVYNPANAINVAAANLAAGDVILIEQQIQGPNYTGVPAGTQVGLVPVEWNLGIYNAIVGAVGNGIVVVEAAGNGSQNLDAAVYQTGNGGHWPFKAQNDSGALIVGAGASPNGSTTARSRLSFSNYGATVDVQGWGENVTTCAYGDLYSAEGTNRWYTAVFSGTSSASPMAASAGILLESLYKAATGGVLTPAQVKQYLQQTGAAQTAGINPVTQNIGKFPDVNGAFNTAMYNRDCNNNGVPDGQDIAAGTSLDNNADGIPDECQAPPVPPNDACMAAVMIPPGGGAIGGQLGGATYNPADGMASCFAAGPDVFFKFVAPCTGAATFAVGVPVGQAGVGLSVHNGCPAAPANQIACAGIGFGYPNQVAANVVQGQMYIIRVAAVPGTAYPVNFTIAANCAPAPPNDACAPPYVMIPENGSIAGTLMGATYSAADGASTCFPAAADVFYIYTPSCTGQATVIVSAPQTVSVHTACPATPGNEVACSGCCANPPRAVFAARAGRPYFVRIAQAAGYPLMPNFQVGAMCTPPACVADVDDGSGTGTSDGGVTIDDLLYFLSIFAAGDVRGDVDDGSGTGTRDGGVTIDDLLYFLARFSAGC